MATSRMSGFLQHLHRAALRDGAGLTDGQLLADFVGRRDEAALAALVRRHGPMVWGVCRRVLPNHHDAEDAFQATFLVLVRKAASIASRELLANWLHGVAHQTALKARATSARRWARERPMTQLPEPAAAEPHLRSDLQPLLDEELSRLPAKYRAVIVLCDLEGKTRKEAARQLGVPEGTVASRTAAARKMLAKRLARHGPEISGATLAALLTEAASAAVPASVAAATVKAATLVAAGQAAVPGAVSARAAALSEGVLKAMLLSKLRSWSAVLLVMTLLVGVGVGVLDFGTAAGGQTEEKRAEAPVTPQNDRSKPEPRKDEDAIQGTWVLVKLEQVNQPPVDPRGTFKAVISGDRITFPDKSGGTFKLDPAKKPKRIGFTLKEGGRTASAPGIYSLTGDELIYCMGRAGDWQPPASFDVKKAPPGEFPTCWTFRREKIGEEKKGPDEQKPGDTAAGPREDAPADMLEGRWTVTASQNFAPTSYKGHPLGKAGAKIVVIGNKMFVPDANGKINPDDFVKLRLDVSRKPHRVDFQAGTDFPGSGIVELKDGGLRFCWNHKGGDRPTRFAAPPNSGLTLWELIRER